MKHLLFVVVLLGISFAMLAFRGLFWQPADASRRGDREATAERAPLHENTPPITSALASVVAEVPLKVGLDDRGRLSGRSPFPEKANGQLLTPRKETKRELTPPPLVETREEELPQFGPDGCRLRKQVDGLVKDEPPL